METSPSRRTFLATAASAALGMSFLTDAHAKEPTKPQVDIDMIARTTVAKIRLLPCVADVQLHERSCPSKLLVQFLWTHYRDGLDVKYLPAVEQTNRELLEVMKAARDASPSTFDALMLEGLIERQVQGKIESARNLHRELIRSMFTVPIPIDVQQIPPSERTVDKELGNPANDTRAVSQMVWIGNGIASQRLSPAARLGAGYIFAERNKLTLLPTEDAQIDRYAGWAEGTKKPSEIRRWVFKERERHIINLMMRQEARVAYLLMGYDHDFTSVIEEAEQEQNARIARIVVTVNGVVAAKKLQQEK